MTLAAQTPAASVVTSTAQADRPLSTEDETAVFEAIGALEHADGLVPASLPALADPGLRGIVAARLVTCGRVLIERRGGIQTGFVSGYDDAVADELLRLGIGGLAPTDRAVLALVLLHTVAIPRSRGKVSGDQWVHQDAVGTSIDEIAKNRHLTKSAINDSIRHLKTLGLIRRGHRSAILPGPQFLRLTPARSAALWEDLLLLSAPQSSYARVIRTRRATRAANSPSTFSTAPAAIQETT